jgi:hypothetical protein
MDGTGSGSCTLADCDISGGVLFRFLLSEGFLIIFIPLDIKLPSHNLEVFKNFSLHTISTA